MHAIVADFGFGFEFLLLFYFSFVLSCFLTFFFVSCIDFCSLYFRYKMQELVALPVPIPCPKILSIRRCLVVQPSNEKAFKRVCLVQVVQFCGAQQEVHIHLVALLSLGPVLYLFDLCDARCGRIRHTAVLY